MCVPKTYLFLTSGQLAELQRSLNQHCEKLPGSPTFCPAAGTVCCAQFTGKNGGENMALNACHFMAENKHIIELYVQKCFIQGLFYFSLVLAVDRACGSDFQQVSDSK